MKYFKEIYNISKDSYIDEVIDIKSLNEENKRFMNQLKRDSISREKRIVPFWFRRKNFFIEKTVIFICLILIIFFSLYAIRETHKRIVYETTAKIIINNETINNKLYSVTVDSRTYFSLYDLCKKFKLGFEKTDDKHFKIITENNVYHLKNESADIDISSMDSVSENIDSHLTLSKKIFTYNDKIYIYIRDLSLFMPVITKWDANSKIITINYYNK